MATASAIANQALRSTFENENYQRLSRLIMRAGTELLRAQFDSFYPPSSLANKLSEIATKKLLKDLLKPQHDLVYPAPGLFGESRDFDISLLSQLLKTLCPTQLPPLRSGWNNPPSRDDFSLTADIVRIKFYRNDIIHKFHSGELSDAEFCSLWNEIKIVLLRIASHISTEAKLEWEEAINKLRHDPLTPEAARNAEELQEMYQKDTDIKELLAQIIRQLQDVKNQNEQILKLAERGAPLRIIIDVESMKNHSSQEEAPMTTISSHAQPTASADEPPETMTIRVGQSIRRIVLEFCEHYDSLIAKINGFVQHLEDVNRVLIENFNLGSLVLTVKCSSLEILERLWQDYSSGHLGKVAQEFLVTERVLEDLGLLELKLKITIPEEDYWEGRRHFAKCAGSDYFEETEGGQKEDGKEEEYIPSQHFTGGSSKPVEETSAGIDRKWSLLPQTVPHFVNRETECDEIRKYLSPEHNCRCLLIHGAIGIGKTTVATKVANDILLNSGGSTVVIYVNCRNIKLSHDFAEKALQQVYHAPVENPIAELKNRLKSQDFFTILLLDNFEFILNLDDRMQLPKNELSLQQNNPSEEGSKIKNLINDILMVAGKAKLLLTSSEKVSFPESGQEMVHLSPFKPEESVKLLKRVWKDREVNITQAHDLSEICSGIPLVLYTLASYHSNLPSLLEEMRCPSPQKKFEFLTKIQTVSADKKINVCIDYCFERLVSKEKCALIRFALLRRRFSLCEAEKIFQSTEMSASQLRRCGLELSQRSLLEEHIIGDECSYTLLRVIRDYCETKAMEQEFCEVILDARRAFILHFLTFLEDIFKMFLSQNASEAIAAFQKDEANVMQLVEWCRNGKMDEEQTGKCIDVFNNVAELLAKMMAKAKFKFAFESLRTRCEQMEDQTRLSDCLTSLGMKEVFSCSCPPIGLCASAAERAKEYFTRADQIQDNLGVRTGNSRAQCLAKLGRCLAKEGYFEEANEKVQQAINIRWAQGEDDIVMLGATFNDQGVILSLEENHEQAIKVREDQTLPIYRRTLGEHPFTATILNNLSNNYYALRKYNDAERYSKEALEIRLKLLKDHRDTAKSFFDLAMVHKMKEEFGPAKDCLERCKAMQKKILDEGNDAFKRTRNELEEVVRHLSGAMQGNS